jgi:hypothetical protein
MGNQGKAWDLEEGLLFNGYQKIIFTCDTSEQWASSLIELRF